MVCSVTRPFHSLDLIVLQRLKECKRFFQALVFMGLYEPAFPALYRWASSVDKASGGRLYYRVTDF